MATPIPDASQQPVNLGALRAAAAPVIAWYERFLGGEPMPVTGLDAALRSLRALPPVGGRLGRALVLVATGGRGATTEEAVAALEVLHSSAGLRHLPPPGPTSPGLSPSPPSSPPRRRRSRKWRQPPLPGMDPT